MKPAYEEKIVRHYRDLIVWQRALDLVSEVYRITRIFPHDERFGLIAQIRRAAVSIPSNIAEGQGRCSTGEFRIAKNLGYLQEENAQKSAKYIDEIGRMRNGLLNSLISTNH